MTAAIRAVGFLWAWLNGDLAYHRYLAHHRDAHPESPPQSRQAFYMQAIERRYNGINRCC